jgi:hypothetical protein
MAKATGGVESFFALSVNNVGKLSSSVIGMLTVYQRSLRPQTSL